jgi:hypothetical protein
MALYNFAQYNGEDIIPTDMSFGIEYNTQISTSPLSGVIQTVEIPGARWVCRMSYPGMKAEEADALLAWLAKLRGMSGRFVMYDFGQPSTKNGTTVGTISTVVAVGGENLVTFTGLDAELEVGDKFSVQGENELKIVVEKQTATQYLVEPSFRRDYSFYNTSTAKFGKDALVRMMLTSDDQATRATVDKIRTGTITIDAMEVF